MTHIEQAIKEAVEKGWGGKCANCHEPWLGHKQTRIGNRYCTAHPDKRDAFLDPLFWQALGRARGWRSDLRYLYDEEADIMSDRIDLSWKHLDETWFGKQIYFIRHLAEGNDAESFFANLT